MAAVIYDRLQRRATKSCGSIGNPRRRVGAEWVVAFGRDTVAVTLAQEGDASRITFEGGETVAIRSDWLPGQTHATFFIEDAAMGVKVNKIGHALRLRWHGIDVVARVREPRVAELAALMPVKLPPDTSKMLLCPMPGLITAIAVSEGDTVEAGQALATVEAMKMENILRAEKKAVVRRVPVSVGASLAVDEIIMEFE